METRFESKCKILGEFWLSHKENDEWSNFFRYNDVGLALAYFIANNLVGDFERGQHFVEESFEMFLEVLGLEDTGFTELTEILASQENLSQSAEEGDQPDEIIEDSFNLETPDGLSPDDDGLNLWYHFSELVSFGEDEEPLVIIGDREPSDGTKQDYVVVSDDRLVKFKAQVRSGLLRGLQMKVTEMFTIMSEDIFEITILGGGKFRIWRNNGVFSDFEYSDSQRNSVASALRILSMTSSIKKQRGKSSE